MTYKIFGSVGEPGLYPMRRFKDHGDGSYSEQVIAETESGEIATQATLASILSQFNITLSALRDAICAAGADATTLKALKDAIDALEVVSVEANDITKWGGVILTGRDISLDLANLDIATSALRDALKGALSKDFSTVETAIGQVKTAVEALRTAKNLDDIVTAVEALRSAKTLDDIVSAVSALQSASETLQSVIDGIAGASPDNKTLKDVTDAIAALQAASETLQSVIDGIAGASPNTNTLYDLKGVLDTIDSYVKGIVDDSIKGLLRSIGDAGATPSNTAGETLLNRIAAIKDMLFYTSDQHSATGTKAVDGGDLEVSLDLGENRICTTVNVWVKSEAAAVESTFIVEMKNGSDTWRKVESFALTDDEGFKTYQLAARNIRVTCADNSAVRTVEIFGR